MAVIVAAALSGMMMLAPHTRVRTPPPPPRAASAQPPRPASQPNPVNAISDLNAAVVPPQAGSMDDTPASLRDHEQRTQEAFDPSNPANATRNQATGGGCGPGNGALLSCATQQEVSNQPQRPDVRNQTPDRDLMGRPR